MVKPICVSCRVNQILLVQMIEELELVSQVRSDIPLLYCSNAQKRQHFCHFKILSYPKSKVTSSLISRC